MNGYRAVFNQQYAVNFHNCACQQVLKGPNLFKKKGLSEQYGTFRPCRFESYLAYISKGLKMNWNIINPMVTTRLWTVDGSGWHNGRCEHFWLKRNALKAVERFKKYYLFVSLTNDWTGKYKKLKSNPDNIHPPIILMF